MQANYLAHKITPGTIQSALTILFSPRLSLQVWHAGKSHPSMSADGSEDEEIQELEEAASQAQLTGAYDKNRPKNLGKPPANIQDYSPDDRSAEAYWFRMVSFTTWF